MAMLHNDQSAHQEFATQSSPAFLIGTAQLNLEPSFSWYYDPVLGPWPFLGIVTADAIFAAGPLSLAPSSVRAVLPEKRFTHDRLRRRRHIFRPPRWAGRARWCGCEEGRDRSILRAICARSRWGHMLR